MKKLGKLAVGNTLVLDIWTNVGPICELTLDINYKHCYMHWFRKSKQLNTYVNCTLPQPHTCILSKNNNMKFFNNSILEWYVELESCFHTCNFSFMTMGVFFSPFFSMLWHSPHWVIIHKMELAKFGYMTKRGKKIIKNVIFLWPSRRDCSINYAIFIKKSWNLATFAIFSQKYFGWIVLDYFLGAMWQFFTKDNKKIVTLNCCYPNIFIMKMSKLLITSEVKFEIHDLIQFASKTSHIILNQTFVMNVEV